MAHTVCHGVESQIHYEKRDKELSISQWNLVAPFSDLHDLLRCTYERVLIT